MQATTPRRTRWSAAAAAGAIQVAIGAALLWGLAPHLGLTERDSSDEALTTVHVRPEAPPPPPEKREVSAEAEGKAAPPAPRATPMPRVAPSPKIVIQTPTPAAPVAGAGAEASAGAAQAGPGTGAGGLGSGLGAGGSGEGTGSGGPGGGAPRRIAGQISDRDYPPEAADRGASGTTGIRFRVRADGRVDRCRVVGPSGEPEVDTMICYLAERRFRYRPATDGSGRPVDQELTTSFSWGTRRRY